MRKRKYLWREKGDNWLMESVLTYGWWKRMKWENRTFVYRSEGSTIGLAGRDHSNWFSQGHNGKRAKNIIEPDTKLCLIRKFTMNLLRGGKSLDRREGRVISRRLNRVHWHQWMLFEHMRLSLRRYHWRCTDQWDDYRPTEREEEMKREERRRSDLRWHSLVGHFLESLRSCYCWHRRVGGTLLRAGMNKSSLFMVRLRLHIIVNVWEGKK